MAALSREIGRQLTPLHMLGERIVLFRDRGARPVVLEDACPHRKLPLSRGGIDGDRVECGYHGLKFDASGACVRAPTQVRIPPLASVRSYPSTAINTSIFVPAGQGGERWRDAQDPYVMISYHFITPSDENNTCYHWLQQRNTDPDDESITEMIARGAMEAFEEDRKVLEAVHVGIANERTRHLNLDLDAAAIRFRTTLSRRIRAERKDRTDREESG